MWGCPQEAFTISVEEISHIYWEEKVVKVEIEPKKEKMTILSGKQTF